MKFCILVVATAALIASANAYVVKAANSRSNLNVGYVGAGDRLLFRTYVYQPALPNTIQYQDVIYRGNATTRISAVQVNEVGYTLYASPALLSGGVGFNNVVVRVTSARGYGYYYLVDVWGR